MSERLEWPYVFRALGILAVFYGHFVGSYWLLGNRVGHQQMKFLATFVVAGFFMLAGYFFHERGASWLGYVKRQARRRLLPVLGFHVAGFVIALAGLAATGNLSSKSFLALAKLLVAIVAGWPMLAAVGWFLVCLFTVEVFHYSLRPLTRSSWALAASILAFGLATWAFPFQVKADQQLGYWQSWWFLTPALAGMVFYQLGVLGHRLNLFAPRSRAVDVAVSLVSLVILVLIFDRNQGPFPQSKLDMPLQGLSAFGHLGWFYTTGIVGSIFLFFVSRVLPAGRWSRFLGENSLVLMCLNSYLLLWIDRPVTAWLYTGLKWQSPLALTLCSAVATLLSFLLVAPLVKAIHRWAPWLTGETPALAPSAAPAVSAGPALAES